MALKKNERCPYCELDVYSRALHYAFCPAVFTELPRDELAKSEEMMAERLEKLKEVK